MSLDPNTAKRARELIEDLNTPREVRKVLADELAQSDALALEIDTIEKRIAADVAQLKALRFRAIFRNKAVRSHTFQIDRVAQMDARQKRRNSGHPAAGGDGVPLVQADGSIATQ